MVVLFCLEEEVGGDFHVGAAELIDAEADVTGMVTGDADDVADEVVTPTEDLNGVTDSEAGGGKTDSAFRLAEHALEHLHLTVGDDCREMAPVVIGGACLVDQEIVDLGHSHDDRTLTLGEPDENVLGDDRPLNLFLASTAPDVDLPLGGGIGLITEGNEAVANGLFSPCSHVGNIPSGYASGVVSDRSWRLHSELLFCFRHFAAQSYEDFLNSHTKIQKNSKIMWISCTKLHVMGNKFVILHPKKRNVYSL